MGGCVARLTPEGTKPPVAGMVGCDPKLLELYASIEELLETTSVTAKPA